MIIEFHLLQNLAPSCLNRDDTNSPKECEFGGVRRARISSQCIKRSIRRYFRSSELLAPELLATRTKRLADEVVKRLARDGRDATLARRAVVTALAGGGLRVKDDGLTEYLLFLGESEIAGLTQVVSDHWSPLTSSVVAAADAGDGRRRTARKDKADARGAVPAPVATAVERVLDGGRAADLALFGRMLADAPDRSIDAACQVAHAISTNRLAMEIDFYTAVDDLKARAENAGADMIGTIEFNSSCFYRYANIDTAQLRCNLGGDRELTQKTISAFLRASVNALPTGRQASMAAHNPPDLVLAVVRSFGQWSLANAFLKPVRPDGNGLMANSIDALQAYYGRLTKMLTPSGVRATPYCTTLESPLASLPTSRVDSIEDLVDTIDLWVSKEPA